MTAVAFATLQREERPGFALLAAAVHGLQLAAAQIDELLRKPATLLDPGAHSGRIGVDDDAGRLWRTRALPLRRSMMRGAWKPSTARLVTQMRLDGTVLSTSVQAERQGPSMMTFSPDWRTREKTVR